jgi:hypothetical protein
MGLAPSDQGVGPSWQYAAVVTLPRPRDLHQQGDRSDNSIVSEHS